MPEETELFKVSKKIVDQYIKTIVLLDDEAFSEKEGCIATITNQNGKPSDNDYSIRVQEISSQFLKKNKIFAAYKPNAKSDVENFRVAAEKADVAILDWNIQILSDEEVDPNADADEDDPRGKFTIDLINEIIGNNSSNVRLIVVYTGEIGIRTVVASEISKYISGFSCSDGVNFKNEEKGIRIIVRAKPQSKSKEDSNYRVEYEDLPDLITKEYAKITEGILPNFALMALSRIEHLSKSILNAFSNKSDIGYISHKILIPYTNDAEDLLLSILGEIIVSCLADSDLNKKFKEDVISSWITDFPKKDYNILGRKLDLKSKLKILLDDPTESIKTRIEKAFPCLKDNGSGSISKKFNDLVNSLSSDSENSCKSFTKLVQHKFQSQSNGYLLTQGTIVKATEDNVYYICIQPKCDSVRIAPNEIKQFIFLKLDKKYRGVPLILPDSTELRTQKSYDLKIYSFKQTDINGVIKAQKENGKNIFRTSDDNVLEWVVQLKDMQAQRIVEHYSSILSRVGIDDSEWFRLKTSI